MYINPFPMINSVNRSPINLIKYGFFKGIKLKELFEPYKENKIHMILPGTKAFYTYDFRGKLIEMGILIPRKVSLETYV